MPQNTNIHKPFGIALLVLFVFSIPGNAQLLESWQYKEGMCELAAKDYRAVYGGDLIFIQPLKDNGDFDFGEYNGWWINKAWNKERGVYYIDYVNQLYFNTTKDITDFYKTSTGKNSIVYNINEVHPPFSIVWHY